MKIEYNISPKYFQDIFNGNKKYELRLADIKLNPGDILVLKERNSETKEYTGRTIEKQITHILKTKDLTFWPKEDVGKHGYQILSFD